MKALKLVLLVIFPLVACTDTNGVVLPYKAVTNTFSYTNAVTNIHNVTQVDWYFKTTSTSHVAHAVYSGHDGDWSLLGVSTSKVTNWIMGTQSRPPQEFVIHLLSRPQPPTDLQRAD
jgi:hypothetical protein